MRKFFILLCAVLLSPSVFATTTSDLNKRLMSVLTKSQTHEATLDKNGEFETVYGGKDISRIRLVNEQQKRIGQQSVFA